MNNYFVSFYLLINGMRLDVYVFATCGDGFGVNMELVPMIWLYLRCVTLSTFSISSNSSLPKFLGD